MSILLLLAIQGLSPLSSDEGWQPFQAWGASTELSVSDLATARATRLRVRHGLGPDEDPDPWYVVVRHRNAAGDITREGYICGRGHVDDEYGIHPILPHTITGEIYDRACYGEGETPVPGSDPES
tara:strand:- start:36727 stop:37101 length:375 start_codon:yes stop_codon:yes gene_type:complete